MVEARIFQAWAELLSYPGEGRGDRICSRIDQIGEAEPSLRDELRPLFDYASAHSESDLEEVFTRTFDSNAERALEVGWHLHGENYARGAFMVRMRGLLRDLRVEESSELPDHLSHVLSVLALADPQLSRALASTVVAPALVKIAAGFPDTGNPYLGVVTSLKKFIDGGFADSTQEAPA
jgi:nitrate reductase assembly molybdenum cofactor insertion protein NarJ